MGYVTGLLNGPAFGGGWAKAHRKEQSKIPFRGSNHSKLSDEHWATVRRSRIPQHAWTATIRFSHNVHLGSKKHGRLEHRRIEAPTHMGGPKSAISAFSAGTCREPGPS